MKSNVFMKNNMFMKSIAMLALGIGLGFATLGCDKAPDKPQTKAGRWADSSQTDRPERLGATSTRTKRVTQNADWETDSTTGSTRKSQSAAQDSSKYRSSSSSSKWRKSGDPELEAQREEDALDAQEDQPDPSGEETDRSADRRGTSDARLHQTERRYERSAATDATEEEIQTPEEEIDGE